MGRESPLVNIVIVTAAGSWPLLESCLRSIADHPPAAGPVDVHIVDNASRDGAVEHVAQSFPWARMTELNANTGFAHANNLAIGTGSAPFVLVLNPDTEIGAGALQFLLDLMERHPRAAAVGCRLIDHAGRADHNAKRRFPTPAAAAGHLLRLDRLPRIGDRLAGYAELDVPELGTGSVDSLSGACMLVRRAAIEAVGGFDEGFWMYGEDLDWCFRFRRAGWDIVYDGRQDVVHVKHGLTGAHRRLRQNWAFHRSMGRFYRKHQAGRSGWLDGTVYGSILARFLVSALWSRLARRGR